MGVGGNIFEFMSEHPFLTFCLAVIAYYSLYAILVFCINRQLRHRSIKLHGWPPDHCDADGDVKVAVKE